MVKISTKWLSLIGIIFFIAILSTVNVAEVLGILSKASLFWIAIAMLTLAIDIAVMGKKWQVLVQRFQKTFSLKNALKNYLIGVAFGSATPGRVGDFLKLFDLHKKTGLDKKKCFTIIFFDRLSDFTVLTLSAFFGLLFFSIFFIKLNGALLAFLAGLFFVAVLIAFGILLFFLEKRHLAFFAKIASFLPEKILFHGKELFLKIKEVFKSIRFDKNFLNYAALSVSGWLLAFIRPYFFAASIGLNFSPIYFLLIIPSTVFIEIMPVSLFGLGTREGAFILFFSLLGAKPEQMIAVSLMVLFFSNLPQVLLGIYFAWKEKLKIHF